MIRKIATAVVILVAGLAVGAPAFAVLGGAPERPKLTSTEPGSGSGGGQGGAGSATTTTAKPSESHPPARSSEHPPTSEVAKPVTTTTAKPAEAPKAPTSSAPNEEHRDLESLRLACTGGRGGDVGGVRCEWSPSHAPTFARYVLWRQDPGASQKRVVFQTTDIDLLQFGDKPLGPGTYTYGLLALDGANKGVGTGGPVNATVPAPASSASPTTTAPKPATALECHPEAMTVVCTWPMSASERFGAYRLYREVPGTPTQLRRTITDRNTTTATDGDVQPGATYKYRIVVVDGSGQTLAASGPVTVTIPG